jgi:solute carrier family 41
MKRVQVFISLFLAKYLTLYLWRRDLDPDIYALAIQTSAVDLAGQLLLVLCFEIAQALGGNVKTAS